MPDSFPKKLLVEPLQKLCTINATKPSDDSAVKHFEYTQKLLSIYKETGQNEKCLSTLAWLRSEEAKSKYRQVSSSICLPNDLELIDQSIVLREKIEENKINQEVQARRFRLGEDPLPVLLEKVRLEVVGSSSLEELMLERLKISNDDALLDRLLHRMLRKIPALQVKQPMTKKMLQLAAERVNRVETENGSEVAAQILMDMTDHPDILKPNFCLSQDGCSPGCISILRAFPSLKDASYQDLEQQALSKHPLSTSVALHTLFIFWENRDLAKAYQWIRLASARIKHFSDSYGLKFPLVMQQLQLIEGLVLAEDGRFEGALPLLEAAQKYYPRDTKLIQSILCCFKVLGKHQEAISLYSALLERQPDNVQSLENIGWQYFMLGDFVKALEFLHKAHQHASTSPTVLSRLGQVYWHQDEANQKNKQLCLAYFLAAAKADPADADVFFYLGKYYYQIEADFMRAEKCLVKALTNNPDSIDSALLLAQIWLSVANERQRRGKSGECAKSEEKSRYECKELLQRIIRVLEPFSEGHFRNAEMWKFLGIAFSAIEKYPQSANAFQNALKGDRPDEKRCLLGLAESYRRQRRFTAATKAYNIVLGLDPECATAIFGMAAVSSAVKDYERSLYILNRIDPQNLVSDLFLIEKLRVCHLYTVELIKLGCVNEAIKKIEILLSEFSDALDFFKNSKSSLKLIADVCLSLYSLHKVANWKGVTGRLEVLFTRLSFDFVNNEIWDSITAVFPEEPTHKGLALAIRVAALSQIKIILDFDDENLLACAWSDLCAALLLLFKGPEQVELLTIVLDCAEQSTSNSLAPTQSWIIKGVAHLLMEQFSMAQHCLIKALLKEPDSHKAWLACSALYFCIGETELALKSLERIQISDPESSSKAWFYESYLLKIGRYTSSDRDYRQLVSQAADLADSTCTTICWLYCLQSVAICSINKEVTNRVLFFLKKIVHFDRGNELARIILSTLEELQCNLCNLPTASPLTYKECKRADLITEACQKLCALETKSTEMLDCFKTLEVFRASGLADKDDVQDTLWLESLILSKLGQWLEAVTLQFDNLEKSMNSDLAWSDAAFWVEGYRASSFLQIEDGAEEQENEDEVCRVVEYWMRLRVTPEVASRVHSLAIIEAIYKIWAARVPPDVDRTLSGTRRFYQDYNAIT